MTLNTFHLAGHGGGFDTDECGKGSEEAPIQATEQLLAGSLI